jgi:CIC family chloride channel protein
MSYLKNNIYFILILIGFLTGLFVGAFSLALEYLTLVRDSISNKILYLIVVFISIPTAYILIQFFSDRKKTGSGLDNFLEVYHFRHGFVTLRSTFFSVLASLITIGLGGSAGPEGPGLTIGGGIGSWFAQKLNLDPKTMKRLHIVGASAGIAAIFHAPLAGTVFALEIPYLHDVETEVFLWALITAIIAYAVTIFITGPEQLFPFESRTIIINADLIIVSVILGVLSAITALLFIHVFRICKYKLSIIPKNILPIIGGLIITLIGMFYPQVLGTGYDVIRGIGFGTLKITLSIVLILLFMKIVATSITLSTGGSGGLFVPSIYIGVMLGATYYLLTNSLMNYPDYIVIVAAAVAGVFAATNKTLLTAIILVGEIFGPVVLLPSIITAIISFLLTKNISIHENQLPSRVTEKELALTFFSHKIKKETLKKIKALQIMTKDPVYLDARMRIVDALNKIKSYEFKVYPVTVDGKYLGYVTLDVLLTESKEKYVSDVVIYSEPIKPETTIHEMIERMSTGETHLYVIDNDNRLIGVVSQTDILKTILELIEL